MSFFLLVHLLGRLVDSKFAEVVNLLTSSIGELNEFKIQEISFIYDEHNPDLVIEATKEMLRTEKIRQPIRYIEGILNRWSSEGITNLST